MEICLYCGIETKLQCCREYPLTGEVKKLVLGNGHAVEACPNLNRDGGCDAFYDEEQSICRGYECPKISEMDLVQIRERNELLRRRAIWHREPDGFSLDSVISDR